MKRTSAMDLIEQVKLFPPKPGVYIMKDSLGNIIYVGKAKKLKNRVIQYFYNQRDRSPKINALVENIHSIEYILTDTELEAFITECRLIKEKKPKYNSQLKNDRRYTYIKISMSERFPRVSVAAEKDDDGSLFFGPYTSLSSVERVVSFIKECYPIRKCSRMPSAGKSSGCLNYSLGMCMGACRKDADHDAYRKCIENIVLFLEGKDNSVVESIKEKISQAADRLDFEKAAKYRDDLRAIRHVLSKQMLIESSSKRRNIIAIEPTGKSSLKIFLFKGNRLMGAESFFMESADKEDVLEYLKSIILKGFKNSGLCVGGVLSRQEIDEAQIIYSYLRKNKNNIMSFWIPSSWLVEGNPRLRTGLCKIADRILVTEHA